MPASANDKADDPDVFMLDEPDVIAPRAGERSELDPRRVLQQLLAVSSALETLALDQAVPEHAFARLIADRNIRYSQTALAALDDEG